MLQRGRNKIIIIIIERKREESQGLKYVSASLSVTTIDQLKMLRCSQKTNLIENFGYKKGMTSIPPSYQVTNSRHQNLIKALAYSRLKSDKKKQVYTPKLFTSKDTTDQETELTDWIKENMATLFYGKNIVFMLYLIFFLRNFNWDTWFQNKGRRKRETVVNKLF